MKRALTGAALAGMVLAMPAQAACWTRDEAAAATVRQLQSMLMVTALRCEAIGRPVMPDYNTFVSANRAAIAKGDELLKLGFIRAEGPVAGQHAYDAFTTSMANGYGDGTGAPNRCADIAALAREGSAMGGSVEGLLLIADRMGVVARLPHEACDRPAPRPVIVAAAVVVAPPPVVYAGEAPYLAVPPVPVFRPVLPVVAVESAPVVPIEAAPVAPVEVAAVEPVAPVYAPVPEQAPAPDYVERTGSRPAYMDRIDDTRAEEDASASAYADREYPAPVYAQQTYPAPAYAQRSYPAPSYYAPRSYPAPAYYGRRAYPAPAYAQPYPSPAYADRGYAPPYPAEPDGDGGY